MLYYTRFLRFSHELYSIQSIAPLLIIKRVAQGRAASRRAFVTPSVFTTGIQFGNPDIMTNTVPDTFDTGATSITAQESASKSPIVDIIELVESGRARDTVS